MTSTIVDTKLIIIIIIIAFNTDGAFHIRNTGKTLLINKWAFLSGQGEGVLWMGLLRLYRGRYSK
jgi:hypothetical protein